MLDLNTRILPPVLDYNYAGFDLEKDFVFKANLSIQNTITEVDHAQIKIISFDTDKNAFNKEVVPQDIYFFPLERADDLMLTIKAFINDVRVLKSVYPQYYKMQIRFGAANTIEPYEKIWGQNPPEGWLDRNKLNFSEWSNTSILKSVKKPELEILTLIPQPSENILLAPENEWNGVYYTEDINEAIEYYYFTLMDKDGKVLEDQPHTYSGDAIKITPKYKFKYAMTAQKEYKIKFTVSTTSSYVDSVTYNIKAGFPSLRLFSVFNVNENVDEAFNELRISGRQIQLDPNFKPEESDWLSDQATIDLGESSITHLYIPINCEVNTPIVFSMPASDFCCIISITNFRNKIFSRIKDSITLEGCLLYIGQRRYKEYGSEYFLGCTHNPLINKTRFILKEDLKSNNEVINTNIFKVEVEDTVAENDEYLLIVKKENGETLFEASKWLDNRFN